MALPSLRYMNNQGQTYDFDKQKVWPIAEELFDFEIDYEVTNGSVISHSFPDVEIPLNVSMRPEDAAREMNMLYRVMMPDVLAGKPGRIYDGAWYTQCFIKKSEKRLWYRKGELRTYEMSLFVPEPIWTRDIKYSFAAETTEGDLSLGFPFEYPHGYSGETPIKSILIDGAQDCDCRIDIYGHVENPVITIGNNTYRVEAGVPEGAVLSIDTRDAMATITTNDGTVIDVFSSTPDATPRSGEYIFEKLHPGYLPVSWDGSFRVGITVYLQMVGERQW